MTRVLFVDDERRVLDALRRSLHRQRARWTMDFACGASEALELLAEGQYSVVVSDMRMPEVDGAELLEQVRVQQPAAARIVLSGHSELDAALRTAGVAHRFLDKPCDTETLVEVIDGVEEAFAELTPAQSERLRAQPALPGAAASLAALTDAVTGRLGTARDVAAAAAREPAAATRLLQLANPAFFGTGAEVHCIDTAVMRLGLPTLRALLDRGQLATPAAATAEAGVEAYGRHAVAVARLAVLLAEPALRPRVQAAALLQHTGRLLFTGGEPALPVEDRTAGHTGTALLQLWGIPAPVRDLVRATEGRPDGDPVDLGNGRITAPHLMRLARLLVATSPLAGAAGVAEPPDAVEDELARLMTSPPLRPWAADVRRLAHQVHDEVSAA